MTKRTRHSEIRVTGPDGETRIGQDDGLAQAVRQLAEQYAPLGERIKAERLAAVAQRAKEEARGGERWGLTPTGAYVAAALACDAYANGDDTVANAETMTRRYSLAEQLAQLDEWGG